MNDTIVPSTSFGLADFNQALTPKLHYITYYENKQWKFIFDEIEWTIKWGVNNRGRTDIPSGSLNPFPNGGGMPSNSTEFQRKTKAKSDLTPNSYGGVYCNSYWSEIIACKHENYHVTEWLDYYKTEIPTAETFIENETVTVAANNLNPTSVLNTKKPSFKIKVILETNIANNNYRPYSEYNAYADGKSSYQSLADSINP